MILTNRSKIVAGYVCPRYRYLKYHHLGGGIQRTSTGIPTIGGLAIHETLCTVAKGVSVAEAVQQQNAQYEQTLKAAFSASPHYLHVLREQTYMLEALVRAFLRVRQPQIDEEFELLHAETEMLWQMGEDVGLQLRCDRIERSKLDGMVYVRDFKTTGYAGAAWVKKWERDHQILAYVQAAQDLMGEKVGGLSIEGLVRGKRKQEFTESSPFHGLRIQQSPLVYAYQHGDDGTLSPVYQRGKAWRKVFLPDILPAREWIEERLTPEDISVLFLAPVPALAPNPERLERWRRQNVVREREWERKAAIVQSAATSSSSIVGGEGAGLAPAFQNTDGDVVVSAFAAPGGEDGDDGRHHHPGGCGGTIVFSERGEGILSCRHSAEELEVDGAEQHPQIHWLRVVDEHFPQNFDACFKYGDDYPCEFEPLCFNGEVESDPLGSGLYELRVSHHGDEEAA